MIVKISERGMLTLPRERFTINNITRSDKRKIQPERVLNDDIGISNPTMISDFQRNTGFLG